MNDARLYDFYLNISSKLRAGIALEESRLQAPQAAETFGVKSVDHTGRRAVALAVAVAAGKDVSAPILSKDEFLKQVAALSSLPPQ